MKKLLVETKNYKHNVAISKELCVVEPKISTQWFRKKDCLNQRLNCFKQ